VQAALGAQWRNMHLQQLAGVYDEQQKILEEVLARKSHDVFVASFKLMQKEGETYFQSYSVLTKDIDTWLPQTDLVVIQNQDSSDAVVAPWPLLLQVAGAAFEQLPYVLPRYHVKAHPSAEQLDRIRALMAGQT
jgi:hypothetical protein